ncbi:type I phosphodiesterase/nucleotide pyrophosphatase [Desulfovibrio sp. X2]|uniref:alkaline phosphatase family protein n=1 Tax=Desulfovibrio sp. X2 TaxID=941449 RepID=UPI0003588F3E|nr:alkaline phosphatase family protein [Desulfovibrio sp. X2]EPR39828.1 type I phosphodiesterase/nucleotide pyrophosphatase [Desulfovibrio sp. X2]
MTLSARPRLAVLGLDGLSLDLGRALCGLTDLPALSRLLEDARAHETTAELPELSPVNWTSLATGQGPGGHGVFGFTRLDPARYEIALTDAASVAAPRFWERYGELGLTCKVVNWPHAHPARPFPGWLVAGFAAPELARACHPPMLARILAGKGYRIEPDTARGKEDPDALLRGLHESLACRRTALDLLWPDLAWDAFALVLTETDRLFHFQLHSLLDPARPLHADCLAWLRAWDGLLGDFLARYDALPGQKRLLVMADHGFAPLASEVDLNSWLVRQGLLRLAGPARHELDAARVAPPTRALALDPGRIFIHTHGRFARGEVAPGQTAPLAAEIRAALLSLTFEGRPVMEEVFLGPELYPEAAGTPHAAEVPDLVCLAAEGFSLTAKWDGREVFGLHGRTGCHTARGALWWDSEGSRPARMRDAGRVIAEALLPPERGRTD